MVKIKMQSQKKISNNDKKINDVTSTNEIRKIGIPVIGEKPWGTHFCQFYQSKEDLIDVLVPYFQKGLENNEFCMWITSEPLNVEEAKKSLKKVVKNFEEYYKKGQIEILDSSEWYTKSGEFNAEEVLNGWIAKEKDALKQGYEGLRLSGNTFWLEKKDWGDFTKYEETINHVIKNYKMLAICSYSLDRCNATEIIDVVSNHQFTLIKREGRWHRIENPEMKNIEDSLKVQRGLFETVVNSMPAAVNLIRGSDLRIQLINPAYQAIAPGKRMVGKTLDELWPETGQNFAKICKEVIETGKSYHVDDELNMIRRQPDGPIEPAYFSWSLYRVRLPETDGWGILNIAWETTQRKKAEEERLRNMKIFDQIQDGIIISNPNFKITYWNKGAEKMYGYTESEAIGKTSVDLLQPSYRPGEREKIIEKLNQNGTSISLIQTKHRNGTNILAEVHATRLTDETGKIFGYVATYRDVTEKQKAQDLLKEAEIKYRTVADNTYDFEFWLNPHGKYLYASPSCERITGYSADKFYSNPALRRDIIYPDDKKLFINHIKNETLKKKPGELELRIKHKDGSIRWVHHVCQPIWDENGTFNGTRGSNRDITERKQIEAMMERQHNEIQTIFDTVPASIFYKDTQNRFLRVNKAFTNLMDLSKEELEGKSLFDLYPKKQAEAFWKDDKEVIESGQQKINIIEPIETKKGLLWVQTHKIPYRDTTGAIIGVVGFTIDITEQKKAEEQLRETRDYLDNLLNYANAPIIVWDKDFKIIRFNHAFEHLTGYTSEEVMGKNLKLLFPNDSKEKSLQKIQQTLGREYWKSVEIPILEKNGQIHIILWNSSNIYDKSGNNLIATIAQGQDITERKHTEELLSKSEARLKLAQVSAGVGLWDWNMISGKLEWSDELFSLFGLDPKKSEATFDIWESAIHPEDIQMANERIQKSIQSRIPLSNEYRIILPSGEIRWINALGNTTYDTTGKPLRMTGICLDITDRKKVEEQLRETRDYLDNLLNYANAPIIVWDKDFKIVRFNHAFEHLTGFLQEDMIGEKLDILFSKKTKKESLQKIQKTLRGEYWESVEIPILCKDKNIRIVLWNSANIYDKAGRNLIATIAQGTDITERKKAEEEVYQAKLEWERTFDCVPDLIAVLDKSHKIIRANKAMAQRLGIPPEQCINQTSFTSVHGEKKPPVFYPQTLTLQDAKEHIAEVYDEKIGGYYLISTTPIFDTNGNLLGAVHVARDISVQKRNEEIIKENETRLKHAQEIAHLGSWELDLGTNHLSWSDEVFRIFGLRPQDISNTYESFLERVHPQDRTMVDSAYTDSINNGSNFYELEHRIIRKDGEIRFVHEKCEHIRNDSGKVIKSIGMIHDITDAKKAQSELIRLASFPEKNPNPIIEMNLSGKIEYLNPIAKELFIDLDKKRFYHPFLEGMNNIITEIKVQKNPLVRELKCEGKYYHQSITYIPESKRIRIYSTDITSRKNAEEELEKSEKKYRMIVENSMYVIMVTQPDGLISYISPSSKDILGYNPEELVGTNPSITYSDDEKKVHQVFLSALQGKKGSDFEYRILTKQGQIRWISHSWSPIFQDEILHSIISVIVDITERKTSDEKIKKLNENLMRRSIELAIANKELETFSYSVSHDLRAPLRSIDGFSQALLEDYAGKLDKMGEEYLHRVRNATKRMEQLIDDMLRLSRLTRIEMTIETVDLGKIANNVINELKKTDPSRNYKFKTQKNILTDGDSNLMSILLENLLGNAWKFTKKCKQTEIEFGKKQQDKETVFFIRDNGVGFNMKYADKLFIPFQRLHDDAEYPGTGIGLGIVARIINRHGGRIWVESEENKGTTFFFTLGGKTNE